MRRIYPVLCCLLLVAAPASAATTILTFDENAVPTNPDNGFGSFTFGGFSGAGLTDGPTSLTIDASSFGGAGVDYNQRDFNPGLATGTIRLQVLPNNVATSIRAILVESDDNTNGPNTGEQYGLIYDLTSLTPSNGFVSLSLPLTSAINFGTAFGRGPGNGVFDPGLVQVQLQNEFGSSARLNVEVDYFTITAVPEPSTLLLVLASLTSGGVMFKRRAR